MGGGGLFSGTCIFSDGTVLDGTGSGGCLFGGAGSSSSPGGESSPVREEPVGSGRTQPAVEPDENLPVFPFQAGTDSARDAHASPSGDRDEAPDPAWLPEWAEPGQREAITRFQAWSRDALRPAGWTAKKLRVHDCWVAQLTYPFGEDPDLNPEYIEEIGYVYLKQGWKKCVDEISTGLSFGDNCGVLLCDLLIVPELNGRLGIPRRYHEAKKRWEVALVRPSALHAWLTRKVPRGCGTGRDILRGHEEEVHLFRAANLLRFNLPSYWNNFAGGIVCGNRRGM